MPEISRFHGIVITMYAIDHPPPHFHARHGEHQVVLAIDGTVVAGSLPAAQMRLVREWASLHEAELRSNWDLLMSDTPAIAIEPLP